MSWAWTSGCRCRLPPAGGAEFALQGNLDPAALFAGPAAVERRVEQVLADAQGLPGHVFNLGHGVLPTTDPEVLTAVVEQVHTATARPSAGTAGWVVVGGRALQAMGRRTAGGRR